MFCPNCGNKIPDGSRFCGSCGADLSGAVPETGTVQNQTGAEFVPQVPQTQKSPKKGLITIIGAAVIFIAAFLIVKHLLFSGGGSYAYVYLSDGSYELLTDIETGESIEIASGKNDAVMRFLLSFSPDKKYIYYYTKYDSSSDTGTLCRAEYGKLKKDSSKNDKYIDIIATNVLLGFEFLDDGSLIYQNGSGTLYFYNGKEPVQIAKGAKSYYYYVDGSSRVAYEGVSDTGENTLYGVELDDLDNKVKLASNCSLIYHAVDLDNILYMVRQEGEDEKTALYVTGFGKEPEKLGDDGDFLAFTGEKYYFIVANDTSVNPYDYVTDAYAESDAEITEPSEDDFVVPDYDYRMVYGSNLAESDFNQLYTSCTKDLYWYGESTWFSYSMEDSLKRDWGDNTEGLHAATQAFIDQFASDADEDGYILVTDEVKAALEEIQKYADNPENEWQWMWLCYDKYQSGTTIDREAYNAAREQWNEAESRIRIREFLQNEENRYHTYTLYCYEDGKKTAINENVLRTANIHGGIMFRTAEQAYDLVDISEVDEYYEPWELFRINYGMQNYIVNTDDVSVSQMSQAAAQTLGEAWTLAEANEGYWPGLYIDGDKVYMDSSWEGASLSVADIKDGTVGDFTILTDDAVIADVDDGVAYYCSELYTNDGGRYCDLYSYDGKESRHLAQDILMGSVVLYENGDLLAYTGNTGYDSYELSLFNSKGEKTLIGEDVTQYVFASPSELLYISHGDLYVYDGKSSHMVSEDADWIWSSEVRKAQKQLELENL